MRTFEGAFHMNPDYMHWYGLDADEENAPEKHRRSRKAWGRDEPAAAH